MAARNWNVEKAKKMLEETLKWRSTYKPQEIRWVNLTLFFFANIFNSILLIYSMILYILRVSNFFLVFNFLQNQVAHEGETGKVSRASSHDRQGRVVLIMRPALQVNKRIFTYLTILKIFFVSFKNS